MIKFVADYLFELYVYQYNINQIYWQVFNIYTYYCITRIISEKLI